MQGAHKCAPSASAAIYDTHKCWLGSVYNWLAEFGLDKEYELELHLESSTFRLLSVNGYEWHLSNAMLADDHPCSL